MLDLVKLTYLANSVTDIMLITCLLTYLLTATGSKQTTLLEVEKYKTDA